MGGGDASTSSVTTTSSATSSTTSTGTGPSRGRRWSGTAAWKVMRNRVVDEHGKSPAQGA